MIPNSSMKILRVIKYIFIHSVLFFLILSMSGCYFTSSLWKSHNEKTETLPISLGKPDKLFVNLKEKKICISYHPTEAKRTTKYLVVNQDARPTAIGEAYDLQVLIDMLSKSSKLRIEAVVAIAQKHESMDYFILALLGTRESGFDDRPNGGYGRYIYYASENLVDSPTVLNNYKNEYLRFIYGAIPSNGRVWWIPTQGFSWNTDNICNSTDWVQLPTQNTQFDLYYNTSKNGKGFDNSPLARVIGTPFSVALDVVTIPIQLVIGIYVILHGQ